MKSHQADGAKKKSKGHAGFQLKDKKSGKLIDALVICFDNRFNVTTILLWKCFHHTFIFNPIVKMSVQTESEGS